MQDIRLTVTGHRTFGSYGHLTLTAETPLTFAPGQFAMLKPAGALDPMWRRAMAIYRLRRSGAGSQVEFIYQVFGRGTQALRRVHAGDAVQALLPLGGRSTLPPWLLADAKPCSLPRCRSAALLALAEQLKREHVTTRLFLGGRSTVDLIGLEDFTALGIPVHVATNDGSRGVRGFVTTPFERFFMTTRMKYAAGSSSSMPAAPGRCWRGWRR
ncbi:hypothetical protein [Chloracidobacterium aggregatum]|uniref:hypothetical protein n=1 Tax=Chloracidobacterium aggregatum TaxID=2851959 RepID=UPI001B8C846B|nr:hypothetical protein [Chloracidobacterium aggregatum]QUV90845.1 hypothetical protein J8C04_11530 [Chloracidobacterium sp. A]